MERALEDIKVYYDANLKNKTFGPTPEIAPTSNKEQQIIENVNAIVPEIGKLFYYFSYFFLYFFIIILFLHIFIYLFNFNLLYYFINKYFNFYFIFLFLL